jgi:hypothetical protein
MAAPLPGGPVPPGGHGGRLAGAPRGGAGNPGLDYPSSQPAPGRATPEGERRPFLRGFYRLRGELLEVTEAQVGQPQKVGNGSATLVVLGDYRGEEEAEYLLQVESTGEVGEATFRWSMTGGQSWEKIGLTCGGAENPVGPSPRA